MPFDNETINVVFRYLHILAAIALLGGTIFMRFVFVPALNSLDDEARQQSQNTVRPKWAKIVMIAAAFLLISGLYNTAKVFMDKEVKLPTYYHMLLGIKILLALIVFFLASVLAGRSDMAKKMQEKEKRWLHVNFVLAATVVLLASVMRSAPREQTDQESSTSQLAPLDPAAKG